MEHNSDCVAGIEAEFDSRCDACSEDIAQIAEGEAYADFGSSWVHGGGSAEDVRLAWNQMKREDAEAELTDEEIENEPQHVTYIDELLWLLEDARRVANREADFEVLKIVIDEMSDGIPEWLESLKKPPHIEVRSDGELLISS